MGTTLLACWCPCIIEYSPSLRWRTFCRQQQWQRRARRSGPAWTWMPAVWSDLPSSQGFWKHLPLVDTVTWELTICSLCSPLEAPCWTNETSWANGFLLQAWHHQEERRCSVLSVRLPQALRGRQVRAHGIRGGGCRRPLVQHGTPNNRCG